MYMWLIMISWWLTLYVSHITLLQEELLIIISFLSAGGDLTVHLYTQRAPYGTAQGTEFDPSIGKHDGFLIVDRYIFIQVCVCVCVCVRTHACMRVCVCVHVVDRCFQALGLTWFVLVFKSIWRQTWVIQLCQNISTHSTTIQAMTFFCAVLFCSRWWVHQYNYSGTCIIRTPLDQAKVSWLWRCPYFPGWTSPCVYRFQVLKTTYDWWLEKVVERLELTLRSS